MLLALCVGIYAAAGIYLFGRRRAGFSHRRHTISELGERGAADGRFVSWGLFFTVGVAMSGIWLLYRQSDPKAAALAGAIAIGYVGAAIFPCDHGCPSSGSTSQALHNLAGGVEYIGGAACLFALGRNQPVFFALAAAVAFAIPLLSLRERISIRGAVQRVAEVCLFGGLAFALASESAT